MKVAVVNTYNAKNVKMWSGTPAHITNMLDSIFTEKITYYNLPVKRSLKSYVLGFIYNKILKKKYLAWTDKSLISKSDQLYKQALTKDIDLIITFEFFLIPIIKKNSNAKIIYWNDATFKNLVNFYSYVSNVCDYSLKQGHSFQKLSFDLSDAIIYSSDWAIESAINYYKVNPNKIYKITFASNLSKNASKSEVEKLVENRKFDIVKLLFLAVDWERKGGEEAVEIINVLNAKGIKSCLYVVGTNIPEKHIQDKNIISYGYINKNSKDGEAKLIDLLKTSSFLIIPTHADCTPVAFSEANSFALPIITTAVGGIPSVIANNVNGGSFEVQTFIEKAIEFVSDNLPSSENYTKLCYNSYEYYNENMSWEQVERKFRAILRNIKITSL